MTHDCVKLINEQLKAGNTEISMGISFNDPARELIQIATTKAATSQRGRPTTLYATFCPFCGVKLESQEKPR